MKECLNCKALLDDDELFCHECGTKQEIDKAVQDEEPVEIEEKYCVHCGNAIEADSAFCPFCGKPQDVEDVMDEESQKEVEKEGPQHEPVEPEQVQTDEQGPVPPPQSESSEQSEQPKQFEQSEKPEAEDQLTYEWEEEKKSKMWLWILLALLIVSGAAWYYMMSESDSDSYSAVEGDYVEESVDSPPEEYEEEVSLTSPLAFLEEFYKGNLNDVDYIKQNVTANVLNKLKRDYKNDCPSGDCLATWVFTAYPPGSDLELEEGPIITESKEDGKYSVLYQYYSYGQSGRIYKPRGILCTVTEIDGKYLMSDYELVMPDVVQKPSDLSDGINGQYYLRDGHMFLHIVKDGPEIEADFNFRDGTCVSATYYFSCILDDENKFSSVVQKSNGEKSGKIEGLLEDDVLKVNARVDNKYSDSYEFKLE